MPVPRLRLGLLNKALRHRCVPLGFGCIAVGESSEVCREASARLVFGLLDELLHFDCVQQRRGFVLCQRHPR